MGHYQRIRDLREDSDKSQRETAETLNMSKTQYQRYETGEREIPASFLIALAKYYKVSTDFILGLTNDPTPPKK